MGQGKAHSIAKGAVTSHKLLEKDASTLGKMRNKWAADIS